MRKPTIPRLVASATALLLVSVGLSACSPEPTDDGSFSVDVSEGRDARLVTARDALIIEIPGDAITGSGTLIATSTEADDGTEGWDIQLSGGAELTGSAVLRFGHTFDDDEPAPMVTSTEDGEEFEVAEVAVEGDFAVVETSHFSTWFTRWWDDVLRGARAALDRIYSDAGKQPKCSGEDEVRDQGYGVTSDSGSRVYWCLGLDVNGEPELTVVNTRGFTVSVESTPGLAANDSGADDLVGIIANLIKERPSLAANTVDLVTPGGTQDYTVTGNGESGVRVKPSVAGYLVTAAQYAVDTLAMILPYAGKPGLSKLAITQLFAWESCLAGYTTIATATIETGTQAANFLNDAVGTTLGCLGGALAKAGLGFAGTVLASGLSWLIAGVRTALNGFGAAADTALNPDGYTILITAPDASAGEQPSGLEGFPSDLEGEWCTHSDPSDCFSVADLQARFPALFVDHVGSSEVPGVTTVELCLEADLGDSCTTSATMYVEYFPVGADWDCVELEVEQNGWPACAPDFTSAHDSSKPRIVIPPNHQQDTNYLDTEPMYRTSH